MTSNMVRKLPIGIQTFEKIREGNYVYVDKTELVWRMASLETPFFLSRPRRFGKSLLLSTFEAYFRGRKDLFKGLAIERLEQDWIEYPVIHLDLNAKKFDTEEDLVRLVDRQLLVYEATYGSSDADETIDDRLSTLIRLICEQTGKRVVVLVDEYDKPLLQTFDNEDLQEQYRRMLKAFYGVLKSADRYLRFVFLTGVTKFSQVSVFSDLNQLNDISLDWQFATLCGITRKELEVNFAPEIEAFGKKNGWSAAEVGEHMERMYDGYHFHPDGDGVFNPFSVLNAFNKLELESYWFQTGTPTFLVGLLRKSNYDLRLLIDGIEAPASSFTEYRVNTNNPIPLIYQSGYLTIKGYDKEFRSYYLAFPNEEVKYGFINFLVPFSTSVSGKSMRKVTGFLIKRMDAR